jgi:hypothetical protein
MSAASHIVEVPVLDAGEQVEQRPVGTGSSSSPAGPAELVKGDAKSVETKRSSTSSVTQSPPPPLGHGESALPVDKVEESIENYVDDWEHDPDNARNWPARKKWTIVAVVRYINHSCLECHS